MLDFSVTNGRCIFQEVVDPATQKEGIYCYQWNWLGWVLSLFHFATQIQNQKGEACYIDNTSAIQWLNKHKESLSFCEFSEKKFIAAIHRIQEAIKNTPLDLVKNGHGAAESSLVKTPLQPKNQVKMEPIAIDQIPSLPLAARIDFAATGCKVGDTLGFMDGKIEFNPKTTAIHKFWLAEEPPKILQELSSTTLPCLRYSDDTIFCDMTKQGLKQIDPSTHSTQDVATALAKIYVTFCDLTKDPYAPHRGHGKTMRESLIAIVDNPSAWANNLFEPYKAGCGAAMRTMPIGEKYFGKENRQKLIEVAIASSYITHSSPSGFLGGLASALFSALAYENVPFIEWPRHLLELTEKPNGAAWKYAETLVKKNGKAKQYEEAWDNFNEGWKYYLSNRFTNNTLNLKTFPDTPEGRDQFYIQMTWEQNTPYPWNNNGQNKQGKEISISYCWPGAGSEAPLMAYDHLILTINKFLNDHQLSSQYPLKDLTPDLFYKLLKSKPESQEQVFRDLMERACLHGGDSDSTGAIAFYLQAACVGPLAVPQKYTTHLEKSIFLFDLPSKSA